MRVARTLNLIAGDGQTNVMHLNTLGLRSDGTKWSRMKIGAIPIPKVGKTERLRVDKSSNRDFNFDIIMANPPFAGDVKESRILAKYDLSRTVSLETQKCATRYYCVSRRTNFS